MAVPSDQQALTERLAARAGKVLTNLKDADGAARRQALATALRQELAAARPETQRAALNDVLRRFPETTGDRRGAGSGASGDADALRARLADAQRQLAAHALERQRDAADLADSRRQLARVGAERAAGDSGLVEQRATIGKLRQEINGLRGEKQALETDARAKLAEIESLQQALAKRQQVSSEAAAKVTELEARVNVLHDENRSLREAGSGREQALRRQVVELEERLTAGALSAPAEFAQALERLQAHGGLRGMVPAGKELSVEQFGRMVTVLVEFYDLIAHVDKCVRQFLHELGRQNDELRRQVLLERDGFGLAAVLARAMREESPVVLHGYLDVLMRWSWALLSGYHAALADTHNRLGAHLDPNKWPVTRPSRGSGEDALWRYYRENIKDQLALRFEDDLRRAAGARTRQAFDSFRE